MIELWDGYCIGSDEYSFILGKPFIRNNKSRGRAELRFEDPSYFGDLSRALKSFYNKQLRKALRSPEKINLGDALRLAQVIENRLMAIISGPALAEAASRVKIGVLTEQSMV